MNTFVRAVVSGFGFSLGAALYKRASKKLGLDESDKESPEADPVDESDAEAEPA